MKRASNDTLAGRRYLHLQREAKRTGRPTDELIQLYALECFLDRLVHSKFAETFILKGGVLLAALDARRPTRDIDFAARAIENTTENVLAAVQAIAAISLEDGMEFDSIGATAETIREEDSYSGIRVTLGVSRAMIRFHVDVNVGDPIWPGPHGFAILSRLRGYFPHTRSFLMDRDTLVAHRDLWTEELSGTRVLRDLPTLDPHEQALYDDLRNDRLGDRVRLEQERVKYQLVQKVVLALHR